MHATADDLGPSGWDPYYGYGRINVARALGTLEDGGGTDPPGNEPPVASFVYTCVVLAEDLSGWASARE